MRYIVTKRNTKWKKLHLMFKLGTIFINAAFAVISNNETGFAEEFRLLLKRVTLVLNYTLWIHNQICSLKFLFNLWIICCVVMAGWEDAKNHWQSPHSQHHNVNTWLTRDAFLLYTSPFVALLWFTWNSTFSTHCLHVYCCYYVCKCKLII